MGSGRASKTFCMYKLRDDVFGDDRAVEDDDLGENEAHDK